MAVRPVFVPAEKGDLLVHEIPVEFRWHAGMAPSQKKKNIFELHLAAKRRGYENLLEISSKSEIELGKRLSAFSLKTPIGKNMVYVECAYQGSKVFREGGPFIDLYWKTPREAKKDDRIRNSGNLLRFEMQKIKYPLSPKNAFYDWLYIRALVPHIEWIRMHNKFTGFTDIEFNPEKSVNCQARAFAQFLTLLKKGELVKCADSFDYFRNLLRAI